MMAIPEADTVDPTFERFFQDNRAHLVRLAHLLTGSHEIAEELVQEAMLTVHRRWEQLDNPPGYARTSLVNLARSYQRRRAVEGRHAGSPALPGLPPEVDEMWELIRRLRPDDRVLLVLRFYEDLTIDEIAHVLDRPAGTIKSSLHRTLARLREELG
jgi:DNA-directed RNA polymerase specialized sigma24 family protein